MTSKRQSQPGVSVLSVCWLHLMLLLAAPTALATQVQNWEAELGINPNASYSATRTMTTPLGVFVAQERQRPNMQSVEMTIAGMQSRIIIREDLGTSYALMPAMNAYREMPQSEAENQAGVDQAFADIERLGRERVGEHDATKYAATFTDDSGAGTGHVWVTDSGVMIKVDMTYSGAAGAGSEFRSELSNLAIGPQALAHFEVPDGYQPLDVNAMLGLLGGAPGGSGATASGGNAAGGLLGALGAGQASDLSAPAQAASASAPVSASGAAVAADQPAQEGVASAVAEEVGAAAGEVVDAAADEARTGMVENTREKIREGIRGLFRRKD